MAYQIVVQVQTRTVWLVHSGIVDLGDLESGRAQAVSALNEHAFSRMLVDTRAVVRDPSLTEQHRFASTQSLYIPPHVTVAVVLRQALFDSPREFEKISVERGVQLKCFVDLVEAQAWLARITN